MKNIINIVVHPGYEVTNENYPLDIYNEQLDKGEINIFLHPTMSQPMKEYVVKSNIKEIINLSLKSFAIDDMIKETYIEREHSSFIMSKYYSAFLIRALAFKRCRRYLKRTPYKRKDLSKTMRFITKGNTKGIIKFLLKLVDTRPILRGHLVSNKYKAFRRDLETRYPKWVKESDPINLHIDATFFSGFEYGFTNTILPRLEAEDEIYVFGEYYNQCVKAITDFLDRLEVKYVLISKLSSYNLSCEKTGDTLKQDDHFLIIGETNE